MIFFKNFQKLHVFLFVLIILSMNAAAEESDAIESGMSAELGGAESGTPAKIDSDLVNKVNLLSGDFELLNGKIDLLNGKIDLLISKDHLKKNDLTPAFIVLALLILLSGVLNISLLMKIKKTKAVKKQDIRPETPKAEEIRAAPREKPLYGSSGEKNGVAAPAPDISSYFQLPAQPKEPPRPVDETPPLYHSKEKREERRAGARDAYLDVNAAVYERFSQGERVKLSFEKSSNYLASPLALVDDNLLYVNFHRFNESLEIPNDMRPMMAQIYGIYGALPGFVKSCTPAKVVSKDGKYEVAAKGALYMKS
ncbi:MAG: hypothetical protein LBG43_09170 [Treponema sp.]|jgi:hypothetical protein|nr:hypothetical protein [Treponema sp.]